MSDLVDVTGTLFLLRFHGFWMLVALGLGAWAGWRIAGEPAGGAGPEEGA